MIAIPRRCLVIYEEDDTGLFIQDTIVTGEHVEITIKDDPRPITGILYNVTDDEVCIDSPTRIRFVSSHDIVTISRKEDTCED